jgi:hypothetical protein
MVDSTILKPLVSEYRHKAFFEMKKCIARKYSIKNEYLKEDRCWSASALVYNYLESEDSNYFYHLNYKELKKIGYDGSISFSRSYLDFFVKQEIETQSCRIPIVRISSFDDRIPCEFKLNAVSRSKAEWKKVDVNLCDGYSKNFCGSRLIKPLKLDGLRRMSCRNGPSGFDLKGNYIYSYGGKVLGVVPCIQKDYSKIVEAMLNDPAEAVKYANSSTKVCLGDVYTGFNLGSISKNIMEIWNHE